MSTKSGFSSEKMPDWPFRADPPQRYWHNYGIYRSHGGIVDLEEEIKPFVSGGNTGDIARFYFFCLVFDQIRKEGIPGDFAELGVYRGNTAALIATYARKLERTAFLLDTFEGFDSRDFKGVDVNQPSHQFVDTSLEGVRQVVGEERVVYVKGYFPATADQLPDTMYCLVHIDCDLHAPIKNALEYFYPRMSPGGFILIHDYSSLAWAGAEKAVDEFFSDKPESLIPLPDGCGSVVVRRVRDVSERVGWLHRRRAALLSTDWTPAGGGTIGELLKSGWSGPESWGVWAIGGKFEITLTLLYPQGRDLVVEAEVHAPLIQPDDTQRIQILVKGEYCGTWTFTQAANRGVRSLRIPSFLIDSGAAVEIHVEFYPEYRAAPSSIDPTLGDDRELAMALHRIRCI